VLSSEIIHKSKTIRRLETTWLEAGERGKPILFFCHGFPDDAGTWSHQMDFFSNDFHVVAPFVRGCEGSEKAENMRRYGRDAVVLDHLDILAEVSEGHEPVICIGHDLGVVHAMTLARRLGDRLGGVVVINGLELEMFARRLRDPGQVLKSWYIGFMQIPFLPEALATIAPHTSQWLVRALAGGEPCHSVSVGFDRRTLGPLNQYRAFAREALTGRDLQPRIKAPVLVLWGRDDGVLVAPTQAEWDRIAFNSTIRIIPGGHWLHRDQAKQSTAFMDGFIRDSLGGIHHAQ
jgi:pimeloyl-ACP methyl ester carboxylesterase